MIENDLIGVFSVESEKVNIFDKSDELIIKILLIKLPVLCKMRGLINRTAAPRRAR